MANTNIPGYTYGSGSVARSPLTVKDLENLKKAMLFTEKEKQDRWCAVGAEHQLPLHGSVHLSHHGNYQAVPRQEGAQCGRCGENAPGVVQVGGDAGGALERSLREASRLLMIHHR